MIRPDGLLQEEGRPTQFVGAAWTIALNAYDIGDKIEVRAGKIHGSGTNTSARMDLVWTGGTLQVERPD